MSKVGNTNICVIANSLTNYTIIIGVHLFYTDNRKWIAMTVWFYVKTHY